MGRQAKADSDLGRAELERIAAGNGADWQALVACHHARLRRMVVLRLDPRLQGRVDPSDVLQDTYMEAALRLPDYLNEPAIPFFLWLRLLACTRLNKLHRRHIGAQMREVGRECRPSEAAVRAEQRLALQEAINRLDPLDREVLALRHFEQLTAAETARVLHISRAAASKRYIRALARLKEVLAGLPGGLEGLRP